MLTHDQVISNINALEQQGAKPEEIQQWIDSIPKDTINAPITSSAESNPPSGINDLVGKTATGIENFFIGAAKGVGSTVHGALGLAEKIGNKTGIISLANKISGDTSNKPIIGEKPDFLNPKGTMQEIGFGAEQVGEFLIPVAGEASLAVKGGAVASKVAKLATKSSKIIKATDAFGQLFAKSLFSGTEFAGKTAIQTGGNLEETKNAGIIGAVTPPIISGAIGAIKKVAKPIGEVTSSLIGGMIGKSPEYVKQAFRNPVAVAQKMAQGTIPEEVRNQAINALAKFRSDPKLGYVPAFERSLDFIKKTYPFRKTGKILVRREVNNITEGLPSILRKFRVGVTNNGSVLNFDKLNSSIVNASERKNIQRMYDTIRNQTNFSVQGVQDVASRINALSPFQEGIKTLNSAVVTSVHNVYSKAIEKVYPELGKLRQAYKTNSEIYKGISDILNPAAQEVSSPIKATSAIKKLSNLLNEDNEAYFRAIVRLEKVSGTNLIDGLVASEFKNIAPASFGSRVAQAGLLTGGLIYNPLLLLVLPLFSPKLEGKIITTAGRVIPKVSNIAEKAAKVAPKIITPLSR